MKLIKEIENLKETKMNRTEAKKNGLCEMVVGGEENLR
jgi:hypothetical protein